jgi:chromate transporter
MNPNPKALTTIAIEFALLSLFAIGGANGVVPELQRLVVDIHHWMDPRQFADAFAIAQAAPGPNVMIVALIGFHVAGFSGALVGMLAMCGPTAVLAFGFARAWDRAKHAKWKIVVQAGLVPISVGLLAATAFVVASAADKNVWALGITALTAAVAYWTRLNPLWLFATAALIGLAGVV